MYWDFIVGHYGQVSPQPDKKLHFLQYWSIFLNPHITRSCDYIFEDLVNYNYRENFEVTNSEILTNL